MPLGLKRKPKTSFVCTYCSKAFRDSYHLRRHQSCHTGIKLVSRQRKPPPRWFPLSPPLLGTAAELRWFQLLQASCQQSLHRPRAPTPAAVPVPQQCLCPNLSRSLVSLSRRTMPVRCVGRPSGMCTTSIDTSFPIRTKSLLSVPFVTSASRGRTG